jgi:hypothetical protein
MFFSAGCMLDGKMNSGIRWAIRIFLGFLALKHNIYTTSKHNDHTACKYNIPTGHLYNERVRSKCTKGYVNTTGKAGTIA